MPVKLPRIVASFALSAALALAVAGCGYKGDLTLPPPSGDANLAAPPAAMPAAANDSTQD